MSQDRPSASDLLRTVREHMDHLGARLEGADRYQALVAAHLLGIVERELALAVASDEAEHRRLAGFLGTAGTAAELRRDLCRQIRAGALDARWPELVELVLDEVVNKVRIVRPDYLDPLHAPPPRQSPP